MKSKKRISYSARIAIIVSAFLLVVDAVLGGFLIYHSVTRMKTIIQNKILEISMSAANMLNEEEVYSLTIEDKENQSPAYMRAYNVLAAFKTSSEEGDANVAFIYALVKNEEGDIVFSVDPSNDPAGFLTEKAMLTDGLQRTFSEGTAAFDAESYVDRWGDLYSAYAPVKSKDGTVRVAVGVDVWASWYKKEIAQSAVVIGVAMVVTIALGITMSLIITLRLRKKVNSIASDMEEVEKDVRGLLESVNGPDYIDTQEPVVVEDDDDRVQILREQIKKTGTELKKYIEYTRKQAYTDSLTKLANRNAYVVKVKEFDSKIHAKEPINFAVIVFDINSLKEINDEFGHEVGDKAIVTTGETLKKIFGKENTYRIGGDEHVVILKEISNNKIEEMLMEFKKQLKINNDKYLKELTLTISSGYALYDKFDDKRFNDVFNRADEMMYKMKAYFYKNSKNRRKKFFGD